MPAMIPLLYHASTIGSAFTMFYFTRPGSSLFSWHPVLMTTAVGCLMSEGLMVLTSELSIVPKISKGTRVTLHWIIQALGIVGMYGGFAAVYLTKNQNAKPHFTTWHGCLGMVALAVATSASVGGNVLNYRIKVPLVSRKAIKAIHALVGKASLIVGCAVITLGLASDWAAKQMSGGSVWPLCVVGTAAIFNASIVANETRKVIVSKMAKKETKKSKS